MLDGVPCARVSVSRGDECYFFAVGIVHVVVVVVKNTFSWSDGLTFTNVTPRYYYSTTGPRATRIIRAKRQSFAGTR